MNRLLLALLLAAACKHSTSSSSTSHSETSTVTDTKTSESGATTTTTTVTEQPGETTTTTEEFGPPDEKEAAHEQEPPPTQQAHAKAPATTPRHGPLVKRTVTVTKSGGETTQTRQEATQQATGASETKAAGTTDATVKTKDKGGPSAGCVGASWIWGLAVLVGVVGIVYFAVKMRRV